MQDQYQLYADQGVTTFDYGFCKKGGTYSWWWLRSPYAGGGHVFLYVHDNGVWGGKNTVASAGVSPGFCL